MTTNVHKDTLTAAEAASIIARSSNWNLRDEAGAILASAGRALLAAEDFAPWDIVLNALALRVTVFWSPGQVGMLAALRSSTREAGSRWIGPLATRLRAAKNAGGAWAELLDWVSQEDGGSKPSRKFLTRAAGLLTSIGEAGFCAQVKTWFDAHPLDPSMPDPDADGLKHLVWMLGLAGDARYLGGLAERCFDKVPMLGARSTKLGNAALMGLSLIEPATLGAAELDRLRRRVRQPSAKATVEKALDAAARRAGMTVDDLAEMATPDGELDDQGARRFDSEAGCAVLSLASGRRVSLDWFDASGKALAAPNAAMKAGAGPMVKAAKAAKAELEQTLVTAAARLERGYETNRDWPLSAWRQRFLDHAVWRPLADRLIWRVTQPGGACVDGRLDGARLVTRDGAAFDASPEARIALWHPIDATVQDILAWRAALQASEIVQPFKQAHREIYRLTDAERQTATYSNRFAGHILRQHQMVELAKARGWTVGLMGGFDGGSPPTKTYPEFGLTVTYDCEGPEDEDVEGAMSAHGIFVHVFTQAVRFRATAAKPVPAPGHAGQALADVPPRCFSEAMRDVDLFVGVSSLGADPAWRDGGPNGRFGGYWRGYAEAELMASGESRRAALAALLPRLALGDVAHVEGRHLFVRGKRFSYRIHIGSGSIFVATTGQYLCIVADRRGMEPEPFLPFEGDAMLSLILSKALFLANDDQIKDATILSQLGATKAA